MTMTITVRKSAGCTVEKKGKKRMREFGNVAIPQEAFLNVLKADTDGKTLN